MKIASISLQNFKSYRELQKIPFGTGEKYITLFEGQMGHGKSNLLNGFYWCLFGQYWDSDKAALIDDPNPNDVDLFNKGELADNMHDGREICLFIEIEYYDDHGSKYTLRRSQNGTYINKSWKHEKSSKIALKKIDAKNGEHKEYSADEAVGQVQRFFPRSLSNYFLFRGENRTQLVKLQGRDEFQQALKELSKIEVFNRAESHLAGVLDDLRGELAAQASTANKFQMEELLRKKKAAEGAKTGFEEEVNKLITIETTKKDEYEYYRAKIKENAAALELKIKMEAEEKQIQQLQKQVQTWEADKQRDLTKKWAAMGITSIFSDVKKKYEEAVNSGQYPPDISQSLIDKIMHDLVCICGQNIKDNSEVFNKLKKLKELGSIDSKLLHEIEKLIHELDRGEKSIGEFPQRIKDIDLNIRELLSDINSRTVTIAGYKSKIGSIDFTLEELQNKQDESNQEYIKTRDKIKELKDWIETKRKEILEHETEFLKLEEKIDKSNLPAIRVELAEKALAAARELKKNFENSIYDDLEKYTQENWEILVYDKLFYDKVVLDRDSMYFEVLDKNGEPNRSIMNTGHSILLVLSFISALIKIAKNVWEEEFPLVMDAPLSEIGETAMPKALNGFGKIFNQTIVILKDGSVTPVIYNQIKQKVGKRYWIEFDRKKRHSEISETKA